MSGIDSAYTQIFSVGVLWISIHCAGMCGPLLIGFDVAGVQGAFVAPAVHGVRALDEFDAQLGRACDVAAALGLAASDDLHAEVDHALSAGLSFLDRVALGVHLPSSAVDGHIDQMPVHPRERQEVADLVDGSGFAVLDDL